MSDRMRAAHIASLAAAALAAVVIVTGAYITSSEIAARQAQSSFVPNEIVHLVLGGALLILAFGLAFLGRSLPSATRVMGWIGAGFVALIVALGWRGAPLSPAMGVLHALASHLYFAVAVVAVFTTSAHWNRAPELADSGRPFLRPLAAATPPVVLIQIALGALYRHDVIGVLLHVAVAMAVALLALILASVVLQNYPRPPALRFSAGTLIGVILVQVSFGIAALVLVLLNFTDNAYFIAATVAHVLVGAATLAASIVMAIEIWRSIPST